MNAIDTNVLIRILTEDEPTQAAIVRSLFKTESIWIAKTVLLETEWVLRSTYGFTGKTVNQTFANLLGLPNVTVEDKAVIAEALALNAAGFQFADALHLCSRPPETTFVTFDRSLAHRAKLGGITKVKFPGSSHHSRTSARTPGGR